MLVMLNYTCDCQKEGHLEFIVAKKSMEAIVELLSLRQATKPAQNESGEATWSCGLWRSRTMRRSQLLVVEILVASEFGYNDVNLLPLI